MKVTVDPRLCSGHGRCAAIAPDLYELDQVGYNAMGTFEVKPGMEEQARTGAGNCPESAIRVEEG